MDNELNKKLLDFSKEYNKLINNAKNKTQDLGNSVKEFFKKDAEKTEEKLDELAEGFKKLFKKSGITLEKVNKLENIKDSEKFKVKGISKEMIAGIEKYGIDGYTKKLAEEGKTIDDLNRENENKETQISGGFIKKYIIPLIKSIIKYGKMGFFAAAKTIYVPVLTTIIFINLNPVLLILPFQIQLYIFIVYSLAFIFCYFIFTTAFTILIGITRDALAPSLESYIGDL